MAQAGIQGALRKKRVRTTQRDPGGARHPDLVKRQFVAEAPNELWVTDLTYVPTRSGMAYVCFIVDAFSRRIVGWRVASNMKTECGDLSRSLDCLSAILNVQWPKFQVADSRKEDGCLSSNLKFRNLQVRLSIFRPFCLPIWKTLRIVGSLLSDVHLRQ